jgi:hypothetical protein
MLTSKAKIRKMTKKIETQLKKLWLKLLKAECKHKSNKVAKLESKIIALELALKGDDK